MTRPLVRRWGSWSASCGQRKHGERTGTVIELLLLQALAHQARGNLAAALAPLTRALALAEPEGYVRIFVDEGAPMAILLEAAAKRGIARICSSTAGRLWQD